jgi:hypothetical protein
MENTGILIKLFWGPHHRAFWKQTLVSRKNKLPYKAGPVPSFPWAFLMHRPLGSPELAAKETLDFWDYHQTLIFLAALGLSLELCPAICTRSRAGLGSTIKQALWFFKMYQFSLINYVKKEDQYQVPACLLTLWALDIWETLPSHTLLSPQVTEQIS